MDDFLANNVNVFNGDILLCDSYIPRLFPGIVAEFMQNRRGYYYIPELSHIDQLGFKLSTVLRLGRVRSLTVLTKDGSPHSVQIPLIVQEAASNTSFSPSAIEYYVVENESVRRVSNEAVRYARHLSYIESVLIRPGDNGLSLKVASQDIIEAEPLITIIAGGRADISRVIEARLPELIASLSLRFDLSIISSEQNPDELREFCRATLSTRKTVCICIAGSVPGLPAAVKSHVPWLPVIAVPLTTGELDARDILLSSFSVPARRPVILSGLNGTGLKKAVYIACEILSMSSDKLMMRYREFIAAQTPRPDYFVHMEIEHTQKEDLKAVPANAVEHIKNGFRPESKS